MTEQKLSEKIAELLYKLDSIGSVGYHSWSTVGDTVKNLWRGRALPFSTIIEEAGYVRLADVIAELENDFRLAPNDDGYFRILVKDTLAYLKTGKRAKQRADEAFEVKK